MIIIYKTSIFIMTSTTTTLTLDTKTAEKLLALLSLEKEEGKISSSPRPANAKACRYGQRCHGWKNGKCGFAHPPKSCPEGAKMAMCLAFSRHGKCQSPFCPFAHGAQREVLKPQSCRHNKPDEGKFCTKDDCRFSHEEGNPSICNHGTNCVKWRGHEDFDEVRCGANGECLRAHFIIKSRRKHADAASHASGVDFSEELSNA